MTRSAGIQARTMALSADGGVEDALAQAGLAAGQPVVVLIVGAAKLDESAGDLRAIVRAVISAAQGGITSATWSTRTPARSSTKSQFGSN